MVVALLAARFSATLPSSLFDGISGQESASIGKMERDVRCLRW